MVHWWRAHNWVCWIGYDLCIPIVGLLDPGLVCIAFTYESTITAARARDMERGKDWTRFGFHRSLLRSGDKSQILMIRSWPRLRSRPRSSSKCSHRIECLASCETALGVRLSININKLSLSRTMMSHGPECCSTSTLICFLKIMKSSALCFISASKFRFFTSFYTVLKRNRLLDY